MTNEHTPADNVGLAFAGLVNDLREGIGDDLREVKEELRTEIQAAEVRVTSQVDSALLSHGQLHETEDEERREAHGKFYDFMRKAEIDEARRAGVLGMVRFGFELITRHGGAVARVALAIAALLGVLAGTIRISVGS